MSERAVRRTWRVADVVRKPHRRRELFSRRIAGGAHLVAARAWRRRHAARKEAGQGVLARPAALSMPVLAFPFDGKWRCMDACHRASPLRFLWQRCGAGFAAVEKKPTM